jgi:tetratricopeptide (TPR) repeat protein
MYCKECGKQIADDSKFCKSCGKPQDSVEKTVAEIDNSNKLDKLLKNARRAKELDEIKEAEKYYEMALTENPENWEAVFYNTYLGEMYFSEHTISLSANSITKCIKPVLRYIKKIDDANQQNEAIKQVSSDLNKISLMLYDSAINYYNSNEVVKEFNKSGHSWSKNPIYAQTMSQLENFTQKCANKAFDSTYILLTFGDELISEFGENEFTIPIIVQCYKTALDNLSTKAFEVKKYIDGSILQQYADKLKKLDSSYESPKSETKLENIFADLGTEKNKEESFLTKPLMPEGVGCSGCGCLPATGCLPAFVTTPIFIIISVGLIFIMSIFGPIETSGNSSAKEQAINARVQLELYIKQNLRDPKSYEHIETEHWQIDEFLFVKTRFRSNNAFGGKVVSTVVAEFNLNNGEWRITSQTNN